MTETLQSSAWFQFAAFGSAIIMLFTGFIKWADKGTMAALPVLIISGLAFSAGFSAMAKSDDLTRDWLDNKNAPIQPAQQTPLPQPGHKRQAG